MSKSCFHPPTKLLISSIYDRDFVFQVPTLFDKQGAQLFAVALLVVSRTWVSDRIASLNGIRNIFVLPFIHFKIC